MRVGNDALEVGVVEEADRKEERTKGRKLSSTFLFSRNDQLPGASLVWLFDWRISSRPSNNGLD